MIKFLWLLSVLMLSARSTAWVSAIKIERSFGRAFLTILKNFTWLRKVFYCYSWSQLERCRGDSDGFLGYCGLFLGK